MPIIGVRELRQQTTEVLQKLREEQAEYIITYQNQPIAVLLPLNEGAVERAILDVGKQKAVQGWDAYTQIAETVRDRWPEATSTQDLIDEVRR